MTWPRHSTTLLLICVFAGLFSSFPGGAVAQNRGEQRLFSVRAAIEEARRSPFHASQGPAVPEMAPNEVRQPLSQVTTDTTDLSDSAVSGGSIFFYTLPVAAVIDAFAMAGADDREESLDLLLALGAIAAPALIAKLAGARTWFALAGSALGFSAGVLFVKASDRTGVFLAPALHAGATALLSTLGDRAR